VQVKIVLDHFQHTLSYTILAQDSSSPKHQGVCFKDVFGEGDQSRKMAADKIHQKH